MNRDGFAFVGIRPGFSIILVAESATVIAHLLFRILVFIG
jgi:hypothetical protein